MAGFGLRLVRSQGMEGYSGNLFEYPISPANTSPIFTGDVVALSAGFVREATLGGTADQNNIGILGVFAGCRYVDDDGSYVFKNQWNGGAGRSEIFGHIAIPPVGLFFIRGAAGQVYTQADIGVRKGVLWNAGSVKYGDSRLTLGAAGANVATGPLFVHRLAQLPGNTFASPEPIFEVSVIRQQGLGTEAT
jgi:hypothetical protein